MPIANQPSIIGRRQRGAYRLPSGSQGVRTLGGKPIKQRGDVLAFQKMRFWWGHTLDGNRGDLLTDDELIGQAARKVLEDDDEHGTAMIPCARVIVTIALQKARERRPMIDQIRDGLSQPGVGLDAMRRDLVGEPLVEPRHHRTTLRAVKRETLIRCVPTENSVGP